MGDSDIEKIDPTYLIIAGMGFLFIGIFGTLGNILTAVALSTSRTRNSAATILVINLCLGVLPICLLTMPFITALCIERAIYQYHRITTSCMKAFYVLTSISNQIESHTITTLAFNRACAVCLPTFYKEYLNKPKVKWSTLIFIWIYSVVLWIPVSADAWGTLQVDKYTYFIELTDGDHILRPFVLIFFCFILPFLVAVGCHVAMFCKFCCNKIQNNSNVVRPWQNHVTRTMTIIFLLQWIFSVPHFVIHILRRKGTMPTVWLFVHAIYFSRFCFNPLVYIYSSYHYKKDCVRILQKIIPAKSTKSNDLPNYDADTFNWRNRKAAPDSSKDNTVDAL